MKGKEATEWRKGKQVIKWRKGKKSSFVAFSSFFFFFFFSAIVDGILVDAIGKD